jgi:hypothetical protein
VARRDWPAPLITYCLATFASSSRCAVYLERGGDEKAEGMAIEAYLGDTL